MRSRSSRRSSGSRPRSPLPASAARAAARAAAFAALALITALAACGGGAGDVTRPGTGSTPGVSLATTLPPLDSAREGTYEAWAVDAAGKRYSLGRFLAGGALSLVSPVADPRAVEITLEPPADADAGPAARLLLRGALRGGHAELSYAGAVTQSDLPLRAAPGQFTMFTPSDNEAAGYPSHEEAGVWLPSRAVSYCS